MLYNRNTNQIQTLAQQVQRGPGEPPPPPPPTTGSYFSGLGASAFIGNSNLDPNWFATATQTGSTIVDSGRLYPFTGSAPNNKISTQWLGYFKAATTEVYTFYFVNDDAAVLWIGDAATASVLTTSSALITSPITSTPVSGNISLTSGTMYPMRLQYDDGLGPQYFTSSFSSPTITQTADYTGYTFCGTASLGF